ncbi:MAG: D-Ala-D-Ala carboxypeptidase family metallohydrolase [Rhodocyclaceae bacterium]|nr:D-Ala-D-Ala carboxypeptidase family metallohydrolase [Rhodocyclaceae bacterium]
MSRRAYLASLAALAAPTWAKAASWPLWLARGHEEAMIDVGQTDGYRAAMHLLRDVRANAVGYPDPRLLKALSRMQAWWAAHGVHKRLEITSGLRTPQTNRAIEGAAQSSWHLPRNGFFFAVDFYVAQADPVLLARWARAAGLPGIGIYLQRGFIHADTGPLRHWVG